MTAAVSVDTAGFGAPGRSRRLAAVLLVYILAVSGFAFARAGSAENIGRVGESAAAIGMVAPLFASTVALMVFVVRNARLRIDDSGVSWGFGILAFRVPLRRIRSCRLYSDAVALMVRPGFTWYVCARDYVPFPDVVAALARAGLPLEREAGPTPLRARLQSYGTAIDLLLIVDAIGVTLLFLTA